MNCFWFIGNISSDKEKGHTDIVEESFEKCFWVMGGSTVAAVPVSEATEVTGVKAFMAVYPLAKGTDVVLV